MLRWIMGLGYEKQGRKLPLKLSDFLNAFEQARKLMQRLVVTKYDIGNNLGSTSAVTKLRQARNILHFNLQFLSLLRALSPFPRSKTKH
jgi:hypothetical protein